MNLQPNYPIRKTNKANALSAIEVVAATLMLLEPACGVTPLFQVFEKIKQPYLLAQH